MNEPRAGTDGAIHLARVFDPLLAEYAVRTVPVEQVVDLLHVSHWPERVEQYRQAMRAGQRFPPVAVVYLFGRPFLADGHKRLRAYRALRASEVIVQVWPLERWLADQSGQLFRSVKRWGIALRSLGHPARRHLAAEAVSQSIDHWTRIVRSLTSRRATDAPEGRPPAP